MELFLTKFHYGPYRHITKTQTNGNPQLAASLLPTIKIPHSNTTATLHLKFHTFCDVKLKEKTVKKISLNMKNTQTSMYHDRTILRTLHKQCQLLTANVMSLSFCAISGSNVFCIY